MTADEIRALEFPNVRALMGNRQRFEIQREIAAQLAEQTALMREDMEWRKTVQQQAIESDQLRNNILLKSSGNMAEITEVIKQPPMPFVPGIPPGIGLSAGGIVSTRGGLEIADTPVHLGCFLKKADGSHAIATEHGLVDLPVKVAQRILLLMGDPEIQRQ